MTLSLENISDEAMVTNKNMTIDMKFITLLSHFSVNNGVTIK